MNATLPATGAMASCSLPSSRATWSACSKRRPACRCGRPVADVGTICRATLFVYARAMRPTTGCTRSRPAPSLLLLFHNPSTPSTARLSFSTGPGRCHARDPGAAQALQPGRGPGGVAAAAGGQRRTCRGGQGLGSGLGTAGAHTCGSGRQPAVRSAGGRGAGECLDLESKGRLLPHAACACLPSRLEVACSCILLMTKILLVNCC